VHELAAKVKVIEDPEIEKVFPEKSPSVIEIRTKTGKVFTARTEAAKGDPQNPMSEQDFIEKFHSLTSQRMAEKSRQEMVSMVLNLEKLDDLSNLTKLIFESISK
jgi:2-methylcitrate dehydratase PrpD